MITITHKTVRIYFFFADALNGCKESEASIREFATKSCTKFCLVSLTQSQHLTTENRPSIVNTL